ncbi:MFS transporter [Telmatobacter bradus]|uniref:MFS transporter n=1 Tax=Telmatobacter bradus TaxID=474953 RepID=UPI003B431CCC
MKILTDPAEFETDKSPAQPKKMSASYFVWILGSAGLISAADNWIVAPVLPSIAASFHVSVAQTAWILTAYMILYGFMQPFHGFFSERLGRVWLLRRLMLGLTAGTLACAFASSLIWLCVARFVTGFFAAGMIAVSLALIGDRVAENSRQTVVGRFMGIVFLGQGVSVGLGGVVAKYMSWRAIFFTFAFAAAGSGLLLGKLHERSFTPSPQGLMEQIRQATATRSARRIYLSALAAGFLLLGMYNFSGAFLQKVSGLDPLQTGGVIMFFGFSCLLAGKFSGSISRCIATKRTILAGTTLGIFAATTLAMSADWRLAWLAIVALGTGYILVQSTLATLAFGVGPNGVASALVGLGLFGGGGLSSALGSMILAHSSYRTLWRFFAVGTLLMLLFVAVQKSIADLHTRSGHQP